MPELPEVATVVSGLKKYCGKKLQALKIYDERVWFKSEFAPEAFNQRTLTAISRHGKYIIWDFDGLYLLQHLRMTGRILPEGSPKLPKLELGKNKQIRMEFYFVDQPLYFIDTRRFGTLTAVKNLDQYWQKQKSPPDPLGEKNKQAFEHFVNRLKKTDKPIKNALLDQTIIVGVGNIYADEALHLTSIHPQKKSRRLKMEEVQLLFANIIQLFRKAIKNRGTTFSDYIDVNGESGRNQKHLLVYQRNKQLCFSCKKSTIQTLKLGGRTAHFCPTCQKL